MYRGKGRSMKKANLVSLLLLVVVNANLFGEAKADKLTDTLPEIENIIERRKAQGDARWKTMTLESSRANDEITFWTHQLSEHALFLYLGLTEESLRKRALGIHKEFEKFRADFSKNPLAVAPSVLPLSKKLREFKVDVLRRLNAGEWIGWIFPLFARHIILELDYMVDKLTGITYSDKDEVAFWNTINSEHASFAAHLLDPSERDLFIKADELSQSFPSVKSEEDMLVHISLNAAKDLDTYNKAARITMKGNELLSIIHPVLLDHVIREGQRSIQTLDRLKDKAGAIYPKATLSIGFQRYPGKN